MVVMSALLMPAMICRFYQGWFQMLLIDVPLFTASSLFDRGVLCDEPA